MLKENEMKERKKEGGDVITLTEEKDELERLSLFGKRKRGSSLT